MIRAKYYWQIRYPIRHRPTRVSLKKWAEMKRSPMRPQGGWRTVRAFASKREAFEVSHEYVVRSFGPFRIRFRGRNIARWFKGKRLRSTTKLSRARRWE